MAPLKAPRCVGLFQRATAAAAAVGRTALKVGRQFIPQLGARARRTSYGAGIPGLGMGTFTLKGLDVPRRSASPPLAAL